MSTALGFYNYNVKFHFLVLLIHMHSCCLQIEMTQESNLSKFKSEVESSQVRKLEAQGIPSKHAEAITSTITEVLNGSLENVAQSLVSKGEIQKIEMTQESNLSKFKSEVESSQPVGPENLGWDSAETDVAAAEIKNTLKL
ncbi:hypothetical protein VitviT2T_005641 [Vitis vinifera]|uniref:Uncharacterized protein n=1 Tax=Vitis vinifera TaxID=29760 RepID=A0ABY9BUA1_VITVI|nr:hypothetical protein VitviT2T_005641 [Vitis vinifera]